MTRRKAQDDDAEVCAEAEETPVRPEAEVTAPVEAKPSRRARRLTSDEVEAERLAGRSLPPGGRA